MLSRILGNKKQYFSQAIVWLILLIISLVMMPNISYLVREYGGTKLPNGVTSQLADEIQNGWGKKQSNTRQMVVVFSNHDHKLTTVQNQQIQKTINKLENHHHRYDIKSMMAASDNAAAKKQLLAKDKTTQLVQLSVSKNATISQVESKLQRAIKTSGVNAYLTGGDILQNDFVTQTEEGIKKTEGIAVVFILVVLIIIFRSPVVPFVSLLSVGVSFLIALSLVMNLVKSGFPVSNFTQVFMVIVMFGIGTDYNILLFNQFKEELSRGENPLTATRNSLRIAGRTILYSGSSVLIGFSTLGLAKFSVYRSAVAVAVGVAVLLVVILTLNPFFMTMLGKKMFWPSRDFSGGGRSKSWRWLASNSVLHPLIALGITLLVLLPFAFTAHNQLNYDTTAELDDSLPSMIGFRTVQQHFSRGTAEPTTIYIQSQQRLDNERSLKQLDEVTNQLKQVKGVKKVLSVTQPSGSQIKKLYVKNQLKTVNSGLAEAQDGLHRIQKGLKKAKNKIDAADVNGGVNDAQKLAAGSKELSAGLAEYSNGINQATNGTMTLKNGLYSYTSGVTRLNTGLQALNSQTGTLASGVGQLSSGSRTLASGVGTYTNGVSSLTNGLAALTSNSGALTSGVQQLATATNQLPTAAASFYVMNNVLNQDIQQLNSALQNNQAELASMSASMSDVNETLNNPNFAAMLSQLQELASKKDQIEANLTQFEALLTNTQKAKEQFSQSLTDSLGQIKTNSIAITSDAVSVQQTDGSKLSTASQSALQDIIKRSGNPKSLDSSSNLAQLEEIQTAAQNLDSATKFDSSSLDPTTINQFKNGLNQLFSTLPQLEELLKTSNSLTSSDAQTKVNALVQLATSVKQLETLSDAAATAANGFNAQVNSQSPKINIYKNDYTNSKNVTNEISQIAAGSTLNSQVSKLVSGVNSYTAGTGKAAAGAAKLNSSSDSLTSGASQLASGVGTLNSQVPTLVSGISQLAKGSGQLTANNTTINSGAARIVSAMNVLNSSTGTLSNGANQVAAGNQQMASSLAALGGQVGTLSNGLGQATTGLGTLNSGTGEMKSYLTQLKKSSAVKSFYIPQKSIHGKQFTKSLNTYLSDDRKSAQIIVILDEDPASKNAMDKMNKIKREVKDNLQGTSMADATVALGGQTSVTNDIQNTASHDFLRTAAIMVTGILLALMLITRSILQPFYIIGTLVLAYASSLSLTRLLCKYLLNQPMLTWNTPFFTFIMLIALGVDYSIFMMMKYRSPEFADQIPSKRIISAAAVIGAVVLSAALILSGTFAALIPSGILTLIQVALGVIIGLVILVVIIPVTIPSTIKLTYPLLDKISKHGGKEK
ncbi:MMPL family transporter [Liquorilactobacillus vini]|uniref:Transport protein n=1 Tax=Liquorilactobacillus vini DSM 20605 TaxID=1133569 RepID=A0A0R2CGT3_9LACO|nr:MMPL family transporter [Liquorilactobacillus vini]KRM87689.1 transport protein [Liquorilactobacillus vini DSM 20605]